MVILHIETSTHLGSAGISRRGSLVAHRALPADVAQAASLAPTIGRLLDDIGLTPGDLEGIAVSAGPGSYTGLRVGGATAKAMAIALRLPLVGIPTPLALAHAARQSHPDAAYYMPMIDARRTEVYVAMYDHQLRPVWPVSSALLDDPRFMASIPTDGDILVSGDGSLKLPEALREKAGLRTDTHLLADAAFLVEPAIHRLTSGEIEDPVRFVPDYLKPPNITTQKNLWVRP